MLCISVNQTAGQQWRDLYQKIRPLLLPPPAPARKPTGFGVKERRAIYRVKRTSRP
jgi:hypothetical protein